MSYYSDVTDVLVPALTAVTDVNIAFDKKPTIKSERERDSILVSNNVFHYWYFTRISIEIIPQSGGLEIHRSLWSLTGFYNADSSESSETKFQQICENVLDAISQNKTIDNNATIVGSHGIVEFEPDSSDTGVSCHSCLIQFNVEQRHTVTGSAC